MCFLNYTRKQYALSIYFVINLYGNKWVYILEILYTKPKINSGNGSVMGLWEILKLNNYKFSFYTLKSNCESS